VEESLSAMDVELIIARMETSYRLMKARETFFARLLWWGCFAAAACLAVAVFSPRFLPAGTAGAVLLCAALSAAAAARTYRREPAFKGVLHYDRAVDGGERFSALRELVRRGRGGWVRDVLERECRPLLRAEWRAVYPLLRGKGRYFFLPYLGMLLLLALPGTGTPRGSSPAVPAVVVPGGGNSYAAGAAGKEDAAFSGFPGAAARSETPPGLTPEEAARIRRLLADPDFREVVQALLAGRSPSSARVSSLSRRIRRGELDVPIDFLDFIENLAGGSSTGRGAGLTDAVREALSRNDLERAAAEFELFLKHLAGLSRRVIVLRMKGKVESFRAAAVASSSASPRAGLKGAALERMKASFPRLPLAYRRTAARYFELLEKSSSLEDG